MGIETIDAQHRKLIGIINDVAVAAASHASHEGIAQAIVEMRRYADDHLAYEEAIFEQCGYAEAVEHRAEHDIFRRKIDELQNRENSTDGMVAIELLEYLEGWLIEHICGSDRKYVEAFKAFGVK